MVATLVVEAGSLAGRSRLLAFGIAAEEARFARRGFDPAEPAIQRRLELVGATFIGGYRAGLLHHDLGRLTTDLDRVDAELRGFAYEGAAMGVALANFFMPWRKRLAAFIDGPGNPHVYMVHIGVGWALARLPLPLGFALRRLDPLLRWLAVDGYGFHQGYFQWRRYIAECRAPRFSGYTARAFDQGLGRSLWFVLGADVTRVAAGIARFPEHRQADLWSGVGLAATYAGGVDVSVLEALRTAAGGHLPHLAQGAAFAAKARLRAGNLTPHTETACQVFWGTPAADAARVTDDALLDLVAGATEPAYEVWRQRIRDRFMRFNPAPGAHAGPDDMRPFTGHVT